LPVQPKRPPLDSRLFASVEEPKDEEPKDVAEDARLCIFTVAGGSAVFAVGGNSFTSAPQSPHVSWSALSLMVKCMGPHSPQTNVGGSWDK